MNVVCLVLAASGVIGQQIIFRPSTRNRTRNPTHVRRRPTGQRIGSGTNPQVLMGPVPQLKFTEAPDCVKMSEFGLCENVQLSYPDNHVRLALSQVGNSAVAQLASGDDILMPNSLGNRFGGSAEEDVRLVEETPACTASEKIIYPKMGANEKNDWLFIVNTQEAKQGIRVEHCVGPEGQSCNTGPPGGTACRQKYIYRKMLTVDGESGKITTDNFRIPSCCVCYLKRDFIHSRFGGNTSTTATQTPAKRNPARRRRQAEIPTERQAELQAERQAESPPRERPELELVGGDPTGLSGSPLDQDLPLRQGDQGTRQQSIETEKTKQVSDTLGSRPVQRFAGEIIVHSNPIYIQKKPKQQN